MTKEKAIEMLEYIRRTGNGESEYRGCAQSVAIDMAIKALEQMPSDDEVTITMKRGTLKCSNQGYIVYNKDWFRKHFVTEVEIITGYDGYSKQPTSDDCVSRQAIFDMAITIQTDDYSGNEVMEVVDIDDVKALPPVTPTQKWISVSERLPESDEDVLVTNGRGMYVGWIDAEDKGWRVDSESEYFMKDIIAWMPLPEPYKAESEE